MDRKALVAELVATWRRAHVVGEQRDETASRVMGVGRTDGRALDALTEGPLSVKELAAACGMSQNATTTVVDRLADRGYVERRRDTRDRRRVEIHRTAFAEAVRARVYGPVAEWAREGLTDYDEDEIALLVDHLRRTVRTRQRHLDHLRTLDPAAVEAAARRPDPPHA